VLFYWRRMAECQVENDSLNTSICRFRCEGSCGIECHQTFVYTDFDMQANPMTKHLNGSKYCRFIVDIMCALGAAYALGAESSVGGRREKPEHRTKKITFSMTTPSSVLRSRSQSTRHRAGKTQLKNALQHEQ